MNNFAGTYTMKGGEPYLATFSFLTDKIDIYFKDEHGNDRHVFWYYDEIIKENFRQQGKSVVRYSGFPVQTIEANSAEFATELESHISKQGKKILLKTFGHALPFLRIVLIIIVLLLAAYIWLVPYIAGRMAERVPVSYEENLGNAMFSSMKPGFAIDENKTMYLNDFFSELKIQTPYKIHITVVKDDVPNAFAMPGGNIVVYDKILAGMNDYSELAALLSHEFTHVQNRHTTKSLFRQMSSSAFLSVIVGNMGGLTDVIISNADNLKSLSYGRSLEKESDMNGLKILAERKIDGKGFIGLFNMLNNQNDMKVAEWMSSHPDLQNRIDYIQKSPDFNKNGVSENETLKAIFLKIKTS